MLRLRGRFALRALFVGITLHRHRIHLSQPATQIDLPATLAAKGHRRALSRVELPFADGAANRRHYFSDFGVLAGFESLVEELDLDSPFATLSLDDLTLSVDGFSAAAAFL